MIIRRRRQNTPNIRPMTQLRQSKATEIRAVFDPLEELLMFVCSEILYRLVSKLQTHGHFDGHILTYEGHWREKESNLMNIGQHFVHRLDFAALPEVMLELLVCQEARLVSGKFKILGLEE